MRLFFQIVLGLVALFCGGCSLIYGVMGLASWGDPYAGVVWIFVIPGLLVALVSGWGAYALRPKETGENETEETFK